MKKSPLLLKYLENVAGKVLEAYPKLIREIIRGQHGVYALYKGGRLYYVGLASNLLNRIKSHIKDRHRGKWDRFSVYLTIRSDHMKELESLLLRILNPSGNRVGGGFSRTENLFPALHRSMKEADADRRALILGGSVAVHRRRSKARRNKAIKALAGFVERSMSLRGIHRNTIYRAKLRKDGTIRVGKKTFSSPSSAAASLVKRPINGWHFWHYRDQGMWRRLASIKK